MRLFTTLPVTAGLLLGTGVSAVADEAAMPFAGPYSGTMEQLRGSSVAELNQQSWVIRPSTQLDHSHAPTPVVEFECEGDGLYCSSLPTTALRMQLDNDVAGILGMRGVISEAQFSSASLRASIADTDAANARLWGQIAQFAPTITGSLNVNKYSSNYSSTTGTSDAYGQVNLSLPIFTSGMRYFGVKSARSAAFASMYGGLAAADTLKQQTINVYLRYYYARSSQALFAKSVNDLSRLLNTVTKRRNAGFASTADVFQVKADLVSVEQEEVNARKLMKQAKAELKSLAGRPVLVPTRLPKIDHMANNGRLALVRSALKNNPNLLAAAHTADAAEYNSKSVFGNYLPQISLNGEYRRDFNPITGSDPNSWSIGVRLTMPIVDLATVAEISESKSAAQAAYYRSVDTRRQIELQTNTLWEEHVTNNKRLKLANGKVRALRRVVRSRLAQFSAGLIAIDPVLEQKSLLAIAEMAAIRARTEQFFATSQLLITAGTFKTSMLNG